LQGSAADAHSPPVILGDFTDHLNPGGRSLWSECGDKHQKSYFVHSCLLAPSILCPYRRSAPLAKLSSFPWHLSFPLAFPPRPIRHVQSAMSKFCARLVDAAEDADQIQNGPSGHFARDHGIRKAASTGRLRERKSQKTRPPTEPPSLERNSCAQADSVRRSKRTPGADILRNCRTLGHRNRTAQSAALLFARRRNTRQKHALPLACCTDE